MLSNTKVRENLRNEKLGKTLRSSHISFSGCLISNANFLKNLIVREILRERTFRFDGHGLHRGEDNRRKGEPKDFVLPGVFVRCPLSLPRVPRNGCEIQPFRSTRVRISIEGRPMVEAAFGVLGDPGNGKFWDGLSGVFKKSPEGFCNDLGGQNSPITRSQLRTPETIPNRCLCAKAFTCPTTRVNSR